MSESPEQPRHHRSERLRGVRFTDCDLREVTMRECYVGGLRLVGCVLEDGGVEIESFAGDLGRVVVEGIDVSDFVSSQLDLRHPERVQLRAVRTASEHRAMWQTLEALWRDQLARVADLDDGLRRQQVRDEWSFVETLRHLVFAVDVWLGRMVRGEEQPYHPAGKPPSDYPLERFADIGLDPDADPTYEEVLAMLEDRHRQLRDLLASLTDDELTRTRTATPVPVYGVETHTVHACLRVVYAEHLDHARYASRDLDALEVPPSGHA
jgi:pimeloyl-ACP methyl ester carboxylesterase